MDLEKILKFLYLYHLHLKKVVVLNLKKFESLSPTDALGQVWLKIGPVVLESGEDENMKKFTEEDGQTEDRST